MSSDTAESLSMLTLLIAADVGTTVMNYLIARKQFG